MNLGELFGSEVVTVSPDDSGDCTTASRSRQTLQSSCYPAIRLLDCAFAEGVLTIRGRLPSFYLKQVVWSLVGEFSDISELVDCIEVVEPPVSRFRGDE